MQSASERYLAELGRHNYVTPTSYLELLSAFRALLEPKKAANAAARKRYNVGLEKLASSAAQVAGMQQELVAMQPQLVATVAEVEQLMARIAHDKKVSADLFWLPRLPTQVLPCACQPCWADQLHLQLLFMSSSTTVLPAQCWCQRWCQDLHVTILS